MTKCPKHPRYQGKRYPTAACEACWLVWETVNDRAVVSTITKDGRPIGVITIKKVNPH